MFQTFNITSFNRIIIIVHSKVVRVNIAIIIVDNFKKSDGLVDVTRSKKRIDRKAPAYFENSIVFKLFFALKLIQKDWLF